MLLTGAASIPAIILCAALLKRMKRMTAPNGKSAKDRPPHAIDGPASWTIPILLAILAFLAKQFFL